ncbi:MAG: cell division protein FtsL [Acidobacteria bacterium]|nr:MAG: cell division protein FtsL [Acidobacteriota bacterium]
MATQAITRRDGYRMWQPVGPAPKTGAHGRRVRTNSASAMRKWGGVTPEIYFNKAIDNSRLVKVADPKRAREIAMFSASLAVLFFFTMIYAWQHLSSIEYGYKIEAQKIERDALFEQNRALRLEEASLRDPERIEQLAARMGLVAPQAGQIMHLEATADPTAPVMARASGIQVVETFQ